MGSEFDLIACLRSRAATREDVALGIGDDAALLAVPAGHQLVVSTDTLNAGVHFLHETAPVDIGWKSLAVNLSDLAAMGASPAWCTLSLSLPHADQAWLHGFLDGFLALADREGIALVGGDTTRGPLAIGVTAMGLVETGAALRRDGARVGDDVWVTGTLGDAAHALAALMAGDDPAPATRIRLDRPQPRLQAGRRLQGLAHSCIDLSDGLLADLGHVCVRSGVGAEVELAALPASPALGQLEAQARWNLQGAGGDDYELCFTAPPHLRRDLEQAMDFAGTGATRIGRIVAGTGARALDPSGQAWRPRTSGFEHFS